MKEKIQLQVFLLFLFIVAVMGLSQAALAAVTLTPQVAGYASGAGRYAASAGSVAMTAANDGYIASSVMNIGGKAVTMPATLRMAANAGQYALAGMRLTPAGIVGTLAAAWLLDQGFQYLNDQWMIDQSGKWVWKDGGFVSSVFDSPAAACRGYASSIGDDPSLYSTGPSGGGCYRLSSLKTYIYTYEQATGLPLVQPATPDDWDALPDPLPAVAPELPYAPYLPEGVPVSAPEYAPADVPIGDPYVRPDGSTAQPRAKVSPSGDGQVTVSTYDQPLTDPQGQPIANPTPEPTADPQVDPCDSHPDRLGCMNAGSDNFEVPKSSIALTYTPESSPISGGCPAPISVLGQSISFGTACDSMSMIKPLVLAFAAVMAAFILLDTFRGAA